MVEKFPRNKQGPKNLFALSLGWSTSVGMVLFALAGWFLDKRFQSGHWWTLTGIVMGFVYVGYEIWKALRNVDDE